MKNFKLYRTVCICLILLFAISGVTGCAKIKEKVDSVKDIVGEVTENKKSDSLQINDNEIVYKEIMEQFVAYLDKKDAEGIKALFADGVLAQDEDIDSQIDRLFAYYDESSSKNTIDYSLENGSKESKNADHGVVTQEISNWFYIYTSDCVYVCDATVCLKDDTGEIGEGIVQVSVMTDEVLVNDDVSFPEEDGLNVIEDTEGEYNIRRVGGTSYCFTEIERNLTVEEIAGYVEKQKDFTEFQSHFGKPNVDGGYYAIYEVQKENGEYRYVYMFVNEETNSIKSVYVKDEYSATALDCIKLH